MRFRCPGLLEIEIAESLDHWQRHQMNPPRMGTLIGEVASDQAMRLGLRGLGSGNTVSSSSNPIE
jgi:hypothetical protein